MTRHMLSCAYPRSRPVVWGLMASPFLTALLGFTSLPLRTQFQLGHIMSLCQDSVQQRSREQTQMAHCSQSVILAHGRLISFSVVLSFVRNCTFYNQRTIRKLAGDNWESNSVYGDKKKSNFIFLEIIIQPYFCHGLLKTQNFLFHWAICSFQVAKIGFRRQSYSGRRKKTLFFSAQC